MAPEQVSADPSPWAEPPSRWDDDLDTSLTGDEQMKLDRKEAEDTRSTERRDSRLWERFANRLRADGTLMR